MECEGSEGELTPEYEGSDISDGLDIGDEDRLIDNSFFFWFGFETIANGYRRWLPEQSRMVRNDWVWVWVWTVANGYRRWFGFLSAMVWEVIGDGLGVIDDGYWQLIGFFSMIAE